MRRGLGAAVLIGLIAVPPPSLWAGPDQPEATKAFEEHVEALLQRLPAERFDPKALAATLGGGPEAAFVHVRDRIRVEAYPGVLRGARLALSVGAANAYDRSALLAELLREKGVAVRFALGRLDEAKARLLLDRVFAGAPGTARPAPAAGSLGARVRARADRDAETLRTGLGDVQPTGASTRDVALEDLRDHVWVQAKSGDAWVDLDASFPDAKPGVAYATATSTPDELPQEAFQRVTLRVLSESLSGTDVAEAKSLEWSASVVDVADREIYLLHVPPTPTGPGAAIAGAVASASGEAWVPAIWVEGDTYGGQPVSFADAAPAERARGRPGGGLGGVFGPGGALGSHQEIVAEWLEVVTEAPRRGPETTRRALFDRAPAGWRARSEHPRDALRPLARAGQDLLAPRQVLNVWFTVGGHDLRAYAEALSDLTAHRARFSPAEPTADGAAAAPPAPAEFEDRVWPWALRNFGLLVLADEALRTARRANEPVALYVGTPRVTIFGAGLGGDARGVATVDFHRDRPVGVAKTAADESALARARVRAGAMAGALEHEAMVDVVGTTQPDARLVSTSSLAEGGAVRVTATGGLRPEVADAVEPARVAGKSVLLAKAALAAGPVAWWEVERDGTTRAVLAPDLGGARIDQIGPQMPDGSPNTGRPPGTVPQEPPVYPHGNPPRTPPRPLTPPDNIGPRTPGGGINPRQPPGAVPGEPPVYPHGNPPRTPPRRPVPPDNIGPRRPGGGAANYAKKKKKGGGNEYLMVILNISLELVLTFLLGYFAPYIFEAGVALGERLYDWVASAVGP